MIGDGKFQWSHVEHGVLMMHECVRLVEMNVHAFIGWYINQTPDRAYMPLNACDRCVS